MIHVSANKDAYLLALSYASLQIDQLSGLTLRCFSDPLPQPDSGRRDPAFSSGLTSSSDPAFPSGLTPSSLPHFPVIGRTLIPRYFRSIFEGGVTDLYFSLRHPKESFHNTSITLDCDQACMVTHHGKPMIAQVR